MPEQSGDHQQTKCKLTAALLIRKIVFRKKKKRKEYDVFCASYGS